jgi:hypothetical protein
MTRAEQVETFITDILGVGLTDHQRDLVRSLWAEEPAEPTLNNVDFQAASVSSVIDSRVQDLDATIWRVEIHNTKTDQWMHQAHVRTPEGALEKLGYWETWMRNTSHPYDAVRLVERVVTGERRTVNYLAAQKVKR